MIYDILKPREERDFKEIYPDLGEEDQLKVFVVTPDAFDEDDPVNKTTNNTGNGQYKAPTFKLRESTPQPTKCKFSKSVIDYGFQDPGKKNAMSETYIRPFHTTTDYDSIEKLLDRKKNQVEYDMDEQDFLYLQYRNSKPENTIKLSPEIFEILITILENEWDALDRKISLNGVTQSNKYLTLDKDFEKYGNDDGIVPGSMYDQHCAVCNDSDCDNSNAIVFCDGCDIAVHQECYGVAFIPEGQWLCRKCMINKNRSTDCVFCPSKTGAFKQLDNSLWAHVICGLWINELYFANPIYMEPIEGMDNIPKSRWKLNCYICKQKVGACVQCFNRNCFQAYHVTCAKRAGLYMEFTQGIQGAISNKNTLRSYCDKHSPPNWDPVLVQQGIYKTRSYFRDLKILDNQNIKLSNSYKAANKLNIFKWKTENDTPIAPKLFSDKLMSVLLALKIENQVDLPESNQVKTLRMLPNRSRQQILDEVKQLSDEICRYWCLKREYKRGAPLVRKNNNLQNLSILYNGNEEILEQEYCQQIEDKINFAKILLRDITKVIDLSKMALARQQIDKDLQETNIGIMERIYFPINVMVRDLILQLNKRFDGNKMLYNYTKFQPNIRTIIDKNSKYEYRTISDVESDIDEFAENILEHQKPTSALHKQMTKWKSQFTKAITEIKLVETQLKQGQIDKVPFITIEGNDSRVHPYDYGPVLQENELSDVEMMGEEDEKKLHNFLSGAF